MFLLQWPQDSPIAYEGVEELDNGVWAVKVLHKASGRRTYQRITTALIERAAFPLGKALAEEFERKYRNA